jgi:hypothetical protein
MRMGLLEEYIQELLQEIRAIDENRSAGNGLS